MITFPLQPSDDWRKLGYKYFTSSLAYREILDENPLWDVTELPPVGTQLQTTGGASGNNLLQASFIFGTGTAQDADLYFPFDSKESYFAALNKYTITAVLDRDKINGYSSDSSIPVTG
jgi:hypothetical protein